MNRDWPKVQVALSCGHVVHSYAPSGKRTSKRQCNRCKGRPMRKVMAAAT